MNEINNTAFKKGKKILVVLKEPIKALGRKGESAWVNPGFFRNFLLPYKKAEAAPYDKNLLKEFLSLANKSNVKEENHYQKEIDSLKGIELFFAENASNLDVLYGSVTKDKITKAIENKTGIKVDKNNIHFESIKKIGVHKVELWLGESIIIQVYVGRTLEEAEKLKEGKVN